MSCLSQLLDTGSAGSDVSACALAIGMVGPGAERHRFSIGHAGLLLLTVGDGLGHGASALLEVGTGEEGEFGLEGGHGGLVLEHEEALHVDVVVEGDLELIDHELEVGVVEPDGGVAIALDEGAVIQTAVDGVEEGKAPIAGGAGGARGLTHCGGGGVGMDAVD